MDAFEKRRQQLLGSGTPNVGSSSDDPFARRRKMLASMDTEAREAAQNTQLQNQTNQQEALQAVKSMPVVNMNNSPVMQKVQQYAAANPTPQPQELPGRDIPVLGPVLRGLDKVGSAVESSGVGPLMRSFYVPGASGANVAAASEGVGSLIKGALPDLEKSLAGKVARTAVQEAVVGAPLGAGQYLSNGGNDLKEAAKQGAYGAAFGGALGAAGPVLRKTMEKFGGTKIGENLTNLFKRKQEVHPEVEQSARDLINAEPPKQLQKTVTVNGKLTHATQEQYINKVMTDIKPIVTERMTPPLENPKELVKWLQPHLGADSLNEVRKLSYNDMTELANEVRQHLSTYDIARQVAKEKGYDLDAILSNKLPNLAERIKTDSSKRAYGVYDAPKVEIARPVSDPNFVPQEKPMAQPSNYAVERAQASRAVPVGERAVIPTRQTEPIQNVPSSSRKYGTLNSLNESSKTSPELMSKVGERTDGMYEIKHNEQTVNNANKVLDNKGLNDSKTYLMNKKTMLKDDDVALAYRLIDEYSKAGDFDSAADVVLKLTKSNLEGGRSIQANAIYNRLTPEGALRVATRLYNSGVESIAAQKAIPANVAEQITSATVKMREATGNKALAQDVIGILDKAKRGETLTEAETAQLRKFSQEAKKYVPDSIPRKRDKLVEYTSKQADAARKRLAAQRNVGFAAQINNPVLDYAIIGLDYMAKGAVKFSDFAENMAKEQLGKVNLDKVYIESWNRYKRLNNMKSSDFETLVNQAITSRGVDAGKADTLRRMAIELSQLEGTAHKEALGELQEAFNALKQAGLGEKAASLLRTSQLGNLRTIGRNEISNQLFYALDTLRRKFIATPIDLAVSKLSGKNREVFFKNNPSSWNQYFTDWFDQYRAWKKGINLGGLDTQYDLGTLAFNPKSSKVTERVASFLERQVGAFMKASDFAAANRAINTETYQLARAKAYAEGFRGKELAQRAESYFYQADEAMAEGARVYGEYMTFQDRNFASDAAMKVKDTLNFGKDFGLGNIFFNYPKTPANIFMRAVDYSPMGYLRFMKQIGYDVFKGNATKKEIIDSFSRATAGTAMGAMGYYMAQLGILNVLPSKDKNMNSLERSAGIIPNSLNVDALVRYVKSYGNPNAAKPRQGDSYASVDWLQPMAITASSGAALAQAQSPSRLKKGVNAADATIQSLDSAVESATNMSVYKNIKDLFGSSYDSVSDKVGKQIGNAATAFVPSLVGQLRNTIDPNVRDTKDENIAAQVGKNFVNKLPVLSKKLPERFDTLGQEMKSDYGVVGRAINAFVNPSLMDKYQPSPAAQTVLDIINRTGQVSAAPNAPAKSFTFKKQVIQYSPDEYRHIQQQVGTMVEEGINKSIPYLKDPRVTDADKLKRLDKIMTDSLERAKTDYRKQKGIK